MKYVCLLALVFLSIIVRAQQHPNDECSTAIVLNNIRNYCSADAQFTTVNATESGLPAAPNWPGAGKDIWLKFTAIAYDINISVSGNVTGGGSTGGTLQSPLVALYSTPDCQNFSTIVGNMSSANNAATFYKGGLTIGGEYYIRISSSNSTGTFKLCVNNYNPILKPGQDCSTAAVLCSRTSFTELNVTGAGINNHEAAGTCLGTEANSAWYKWTAENNGTLAFTITPTVSNDDIDWILYDLGIIGNCGNVTAANAIRCAAGHGVDNSGCRNEALYYKTGLNMTETDFNEAGGCGAGQNGFVKYIDMQQGHVYALLVDNFSSSNNGFTIDFSGTGQFLGPESKFSLDINQPCTSGQNYVFTNQSTNYGSLRWTFGSGANIPNSTDPGPHTITYSTPGIKTVVLEAIGDKGCFTVSSQTFSVGFKPPLPIINNTKSGYCLGEIITLNTPNQTNAVYKWTGPNGFISSLREVLIPVATYNVAGVYSLTVTIFGCTSDAETIIIPPISKTPVNNFSITENNSCTNQQSFTFNNLSTDFNSLKWDFGSGASQASGTGQGPFTITYNSPGVRSIGLEAQGDAGCVVSLVKTLEVPAVPQQPVISSNKPDFCLKDTIFLSTEVQAGATYQWRGPNNFSSSEPAVRIPVNGYGVAGRYTLVVSMGRCSTRPDSIIIPPILKNPTAAFSSIPNIPAKLSFPVTIQFTNMSADADTYLWDFGDGETSEELHPSHIYTHAGDYSVSLTAFKSNVCSASVMKGRFVIKAGNALFIPNTFTPNGDGINDEFVVTITNLVSYNIKIFNRWGTSLFESVDIFDNWKGLYKGEPLPVGTYYYVLHTVDLNGVSTKKSGSVTVIR
ncbi:PKD domain-containing protein [Pedobacter sp. P351]|uniref:PKD domain-containing protein n=1 Tax=Pedobacter superstes TaxID=3133441 RepID=UPI00309699D1